SIDNYVPMNFNDHYDLHEQGIVADYVIIMGYDEHYAGSQEAGSVASLSYVENGIIDTVDKVDASKVINAVPFYTRIWHTSGGQVSSEAVSMKVAKEYISNHSIDMQWNSETGQNYGEYTGSDGVLNQIWMEDAESIGQKIDSMRASGIAGIAEWSLGMETSDVWEVIANYVNG
ncbi:MAG: chitinase, partial [Butyrivibrio sp.]|nr:chitinase [Butyrivibrio sp.]